MRLEPRSYWRTQQPWYMPVHRWIRKQQGKPTHCENCGAMGKRMYHWANISGEYRYDPQDWLQLCVPCHRRMDFTEDMRENMRVKSRGNTNRRKPLHQFNINGVYIATYSNGYEASERTGTNRISIQHVLAGKHKTANGFRWSRKLEKGGS